MLPSSGTDTSIPPAPPADVDLSTSVGAEVTVTYTYVSDTRPPDPPTIVSSPPAFTADPNPVITFTAEAGAVTECLLATPTSAGSWGTVHQPVARRPRRRRRRALLVQRAGHRRRRQRRRGERPEASPSTGPRPLQPVLTFEPPPLGQSAHPTWAFTIETGATARCSLDWSVAHRLQLAVRAGPQRRRRRQPHLLRLRRRRRRQHRTGRARHLRARSAGPCRPDHHHPTGEPRQRPDPDLGDPARARRRDRELLGRRWPVHRRAAPPSPPTCPPPPMACTPSRCATPTGRQPEHLDRRHLRPRSPRPGRPHHHEPTVALERDHAGLEHRVRWPGRTRSAASMRGRGSRAPDRSRRRSRRGATACTCSPSAPPTGRGTEDPRRPPPTRSTPPHPDAPLIATAPADPSNSPTPIWTFTVDADSTATCSLDGGPWVACTSPHQVDLTSSPDGIHQLAVRATDAQSNVGPSAVSALHARSRCAGSAVDHQRAQLARFERHGVVVLHHPGRHHHPLPSRHRSGLQLRRLGDEDVHRRRPAPVHGGGRRPRRQPQRHHDGDVHARSGRPRAADDHPLAHDPGPGHHPPVDVRHRT